MAIVDVEVLKKELNDIQAEAAYNTEGAMLILAGAGSGKTRTITYKIAHLVSAKQVDPRRILAVTFTNKAAREMKERIQKILGARVNLEWMGTFHSMCVRILRLCLSKPQITAALGWTTMNENFTIYDDDDQKKIVRDILKADKGEAFEASDIKKVRSAISHFKNTVMKTRALDGSYKLVLQTPDIVLSNAEFKDQEQMALYYRSYQKKLMESNALDFDDLLLKTVDLFQKLPMIASQFASRYEYVFVDEYQDTNDVQYELLKLLTDGNRNVTVVGDDDQSIYGWRGANIEIIRNFHKDFSPVRIVKLEQNYRSTSNIVKGAGSVIAHNERPAEMQKNVFSAEEAGDPIVVTYVGDDRSEAEKIAKRILDAGKENYAETAVFYRTNAQSRVLEKALNDLRIPNVIFGGTRFWDRKEIKDILAYLRLVANPRDDAALFRILNVPARAIGKTTADQLQEAATINDVSVWEVIENSLDSLGRSAPKVASFRDLIVNLRNEAASGEVPLPILAEHVIVNTHYKEFLEKEDETTAEDRKGNLDELVNAIREFDEEHPNATLESFLQDISLLTDADKKVENSAERVTLMTMHMAKGLEFKHVHIGGCDENVFPLSRMSMTMTPKEQNDQMEEERRLFYVGCTRAKKKLFLYHSRCRFVNGQFQYLDPSRFLEEMDPSVVDLREELDARNRDFDGDNRFVRQSSSTFTGGIQRGFSYDRPQGTRPMQRPQYGSYGSIRPGSSNSSGMRPAASRFGSASGRSGVSAMQGGAGKSQHIVYGKNAPILPKLNTSGVPKAEPRVEYDDPLHPGAKVRHAKYGNGILLRKFGSGENQRVEVHFADGTVRTLVLKFAGLQIIG